MYQLFFFKRSGLWPLETCITDVLQRKTYDHFEEIEKGHIWCHNATVYFGRNRRFSRSC